MKKLSVVVVVLLLVSMVTYGSGWREDGSTVRLRQSSDNVGIGISSANEKLEVLGNIRIKGPDGFNSPGEEAILKLGDNNHYIKSEWGYGVHIGTAGVGDIINIKENVGRVGIGTTTPDYKLDVNGTIRAKEIKVETGWSDFVFADSYNLMTLDKLERHIKANKSLPGIPTEKQVLENGVSLGEMQTKFLEKIEELTLYVINQDKELKELKKENGELKERISILERQ